MYTFFNLKSFLKFLCFFLITFSFHALYTESDKYAFSFYLPGVYKRHYHKNPYDPFYQFDHKDGYLFIHFWGRYRPRGAKLKFLKEAYEEDFMKSFIKRILKEGQKAKTDLKNVSLLRYTVELEEQEYKLDLYLAKTRRFFYVMAFYYQPEHHDKVSRDIDLMIYSAIYGR